MTMRDYFRTIFHESDVCAACGTEFYHIFSHFRHRIAHLWSLDYRDQIQAALYELLRNITLNINNLWKNIFVCYWHVNVFFITDVKIGNQQGGHLKTRETWSITSKWKWVNMKMRLRLCIIARWSEWGWIVSDDELFLLSALINYGCEFRAWMLNN
jgi:hypothetical protein